MAKKAKGKLGPIVRTPTPIQMQYQRRLRKIAGQLARSVKGMELKGKTKREILNELRKLRVSWMDGIAEEAEDVAGKFTSSIDRAATANLNKMLEQYGIATVAPKYTEAIRETARHAAAENVKLIKSLGSEYFSAIEKSVIAAFEIGEASQSEIYKAITGEIATRGKQLDRRAARIARDQTSKVFGTLNRERSIAAGITKGAWLHSHSGKQPRPGHLKANGKIFDLKKGAYIDNASATAKKRDFRWTWPGYEVECGCSYRPYIEGVTE